MEFRALGPIEVFADDGQLVSVTKPRHRATLCVLLLNSGTLLPRSYLTEALWGADLPGDPDGALRSYVYNLRKYTGIGLRLRTHASCYKIELRDSDTLDSRVFLALIKRASEASHRADHAAGASLLGQAMAIWRNPPLADLPETPNMRPIFTEFTEWKNKAQDALIDARMILGEHQDLIPRLTALATEEPLREYRWQQLMLALYRSNRQVEALDVYTRARAVLKDEFGLEPSRDLQVLQDKILAHDPALQIRPRGTARLLPQEKGPRGPEDVGRAGEKARSRIGLEARAAAIAAQISAELARVPFVLPGIIPERVFRQRAGEENGEHGAGRLADDRPGGYRPWPDTSRRLRELLAALESLAQEAAEADLGPEGISEAPGN